MSIAYIGPYELRSRAEPPLSNGALFSETADGAEGGASRGAGLQPRRDAVSQPSRLASSVADLDQFGAGWFDTDSRPCFVVGADATVVQANPAAVTLIDRKVLSVRGGVLSFGRAQADNVLLEALAAAACGSARPRQLVLLGGDQVWRSLTLHRAASVAALVFLSIRTEARTDPLAMEALIQAFHLTPAQAKVVVCLAEGLVPKEIGKRMDVSTNTIRTHLRAIYGKLKVRGIAGALRLTSQLL